MQLNWGHKLTIGMISFMVFIALLVTGMMREKIDLVEKNYYEHGMKYQQEINSKMDAENLLSLSYQTNALILKPSTNQNINGAIKFYRPSDETKDFEIDFSTINGNENLIPLNGIDKGLWTIKLTWNDNNGLHTIEKQITIN